MSALNRLGIDPSVLGAQPTYSQRTRTNQADICLQVVQTGQL